MQRIILVLFLAAATHGSVSAQRSLFPFGGNPFAEKPSGPNGSSPSSASEASPSANDRYSTYQQAMDTKSLIHRNAALRADQRRRRLAARRWFGYSNSRPVAAAAPFMTHYSPMWAGNPWTPYHWYGMYWP